MKPFSGGQLLHDRTSPFGKELTEYQCIQYALDKPGVLTVLPGIRNRADLQRILGFLSASQAEKDYSVLGTFAPRTQRETASTATTVSPAPPGWMWASSINIMIWRGREISWPRATMRSWRKRPGTVSGADTVTGAVRFMCLSLREWVKSKHIDVSDEPKVLVAYFYATNTTKPLAEYISDSLNADLYEIVPQTPYTSADLMTIFCWRRLSNTWKAPFPALRSVRHWLWPLHYCRQDPCVRTVIHKSYFL